MNRFPIPSIRAIITDNKDRVLLLKRSDTKYGSGAWCLPGGKINFGQSIEQAIISEIQEETSLRCKAIEFLFYQDNLPTKSLDTHYITLYFKCYVEGEVTTNSESSDFLWVKSDELDNYDIAFMNRQAVKQYFNES